MSPQYSFQVDTELAAQGGVVHPYFFPAISQQCHDLTLILHVVEARYVQEHAYHELCHNERGEVVVLLGVGA